ncbi:histidine kinase OS=Streptomyces griseus subsp. griseus (strain JCM 4626 / NBRC) OX=455632 GN=SGR_5300 PE=4 SV=1 [Streptomyces griseus subsp. griseus]
MTVFSGRLRPAALAAGRGLFLSVVGLPVSITLFVLAMLSVAFIPLGIGVLSTPTVLEAVRKHANQRRLWAMTWSGVRIPVPYRPLPKGPAGGRHRPGGAHHLDALRDPATRRDLQWLLVDMTAGTVLAILAAALMIYPVEGLVLAAGLWRVFRDDPYWYGVVPVDSQTSGIAALALGIAIFHIGLRTSGPLLRAHFLLAGTLLAPTRDQELAQRVRRLTETRHEAVDTAASELRRIERDLHDGRRPGWSRWA